MKDQTLFAFHTCWSLMFRRYESTIDRGYARGDVLIYPSLSLLDWRHSHELLCTSLRQISLLGDVLVAARAAIPTRIQNVDED